MSLNFPDFLGPPQPAASQRKNSTSDHASQNASRQQLHDSPSSTNNHGSQFASGPFATPGADHSRPEFDDLLRSKLSALEHHNEAASPLSRPFSGSPLPASGNFQPLGSSGSKFSPFAPNYGHPSAHFDAFNLPSELQGGIGTISSRRPSYAAESFTRNQQIPLASSMPPGSLNKTSLATFAAANNYSINNMGQSAYGFDQLTDLFQNFSLNASLSDFQARRPLQLVDFQPFPQHPVPAQYLNPSYPQFQLFSSPTHKAPDFNSVVPGGSPHSKATADPPVPSFLAPGPGQTMKLDNGLLLKDQYIMASADLKVLYSSVLRYFQDVDTSKEIMDKLRSLLNNEVVLKLMTFIKNLNNLNFNHKMLCLVINKNGKLDLLSYPSNSNIFLQHDDLVIVDGDRGKDLVMILEPLVSLNMAILFNFLKKLEHLKSLTITDSSGGTSVKNNHCGGTHSTSLKASSIINNHSNEDNEFIINLPTKQVLRFATPKEVQKLSGKFLEEKKAFITCYNKIKELGLNNDLTLINVEYQCDFKKLIFYYFANFKRIDFRGLIKELFKIYKTRIWLCAVLPYDHPELYTNKKIQSSASQNAGLGGIPKEYDLSNELIMNFSVAEFDKLPLPSYFHLKNMLNLIDYLIGEVQGSFYGFNVSDNKSTANRFDTSRAGNDAPSPGFNPFGDGK